MASATEIRQLDDDELENRLTNARKELFNLRFQAATGRLDNYARTGQVRREIARLLTVQRDREIEQAEELVRSAGTSRSEEE
jgi:large subunit ribosomal protein L29